MEIPRYLKIVGCLLVFAGALEAHAQSPNETWYRSGLLWGLYGDGSTPANTYGSQAAEAWGRGHTDCGTVYVGIIGDGLMTTHDDLAANVGRNPGDSTFDGIDNDANGYVDDVYGWDFLGNDNTVFGGTTADGWSTGLAGTIGAVGNNRKGVVGVCWRVRLLTARVTSLVSNEPGESVAAVVRAIDYMTNLRLRGVNLVATVNLWGDASYGSVLTTYSSLIQAAIDRAGAANVLFIAPSGFDGVNLDTATVKAWQGYPARYAGTHVIGVADIDANGSLSPFSNWGSTTVDIAAPGIGIRTTALASKPRSSTVVSGYGNNDGTSSGFVAGAAALYRAYHPTATAVQIRSAILSSGATTPSLNGKVLNMKRLDASSF